MLRFARLKIVLANYPLRTKLVRLKTTLNPTKKSSIKGGLFCWLGWLDWVLPLKNSRVLLAMLRLKHHVSLSKLLSLTFVFANYPLRTKLVRLKTTLSNKKILHKRRTFLLAGDDLQSSSKLLLVVK